MLRSDKNFRVSSPTSHIQYARVGKIRQPFAPAAAPSHDLMRTALCGPGVRLRTKLLFNIVMMGMRCHGSALLL